MSRAPYPGSTGFQSAAARWPIAPYRDAAAASPPTYRGRAARAPRCRTAIPVLLGLLLLAGCSGGKEAEATADARERDSDGADAQVEETVPAVRREFVILRELVRQHGLQQGNDKRMEAVETALREKFPALPDKGATEEEQAIYRSAAELMESLR